MMIIPVQQAAAWAPLVKLTDSDCLQFCSLFSLIQAAMIILVQNKALFIRLKRKD